jgi:RHS repeat-associated protein
MKILLFLFPIFLHAHNFYVPVRSPLEPTQMDHQYPVDLFTGRYSYKKAICLIDGVEPLVIQIGSLFDQKKERNYSPYHHDLFPHLTLKIDGKDLFYTDSYGNDAYYKKSKDNFYFFSCYAKSPFNIHQPALGALFASLHDRISMSPDQKSVQVFTSEGGRRLYKRIKKHFIQSDMYLLHEETTPHHHRFHYHYNKDNQLIKITCTSKNNELILGEANFYYPFSFVEDDPSCEITTSNGLVYTLDYFPIKYHYFVKRIVYPDLTEEHFSLDKDYRINKHIYPNNVNEFITYDVNGKVSSITYGNSSTYFSYTQYSTTITDPLGHKTKYTFLENGATETISYYENNNHLYSEKFLFDKTKKLLSKLYYKPDETLFFSRTLSYDSKGNVIKEELFDLPPIYYEYDNQNRMTKILKNGEKEKIISYHKGSSLPKEIKTGGKNYTFFYDNENLLIQETTKERTHYYENNQQGLPSVIKTENLEIHLNYNGSLLTEKTVLDLQGNLLSEEFYEHDSVNRIIQETKGGKTLLYFYDDFGRKTATHNPQTNLSERFVYDDYSRLISIEEKFPGSSSLNTSFTYDVLGRKIKEISPEGLNTSLKYDRFNRVIERKNSYSTTKIQFDLLGNEIETQTDNLRPTTTNWNYLRQPIKITYPDQYEKKFFYLPDQTLSKIIDSYGLETFYTYDFDKLLMIEDSRGNNTTYIYDSFGRIEEKIINGESTYFEYDPLDRVIKTRSNDLILETLYNERNELTSEMIYDLDATLFSKKTHSYDRSGNCINTKIYGNNKNYEEIKSYDPKGRLISCEDTSGKKSTFTYEKNRITTNSHEGLTIQKDYNSVGQVLHSVKTKDNQILQEEYYGYNSYGSLINTSYLKQEYDSMQRLISLEEPQGKITTFSYNKQGAVTKKTKPDGTSISYTYNNRGELVQEISSDRTIHYVYTYNERGHLVHIVDRILNKTHAITYDFNGNILQEFFPNGLKIEKSYDHRNQPAKLLLSDDSFIEYQYNSFHLKKIIRKDWEHTYDQYDLSGKLLQETLPYDIGKVCYTLNDSLSINSIESPFHSESFSEKTYTINNNKVYFSHDSLDCLIQDGSNNYQYNNQYDRIQKNEKLYRFNSLHQNVEHIYNKNGCLTQKEDVEFSYDARDRLTQVKTKNLTIYYSYDSFDRRMTKTIIDQNNAKSNYHFLWDGEKEIGLTDEKNNFLELRILGVGKHADIGATIAIELNKKTFIPLHDLFGNITHLIDPETKQIASYTEYTPFGEESCQIESPWTFQSKRLDPETNLVYFGKRYYDPIDGTFLTPDPVGPLSEQNLYVYALANPLSYHDPLGLTPIPSDSVTWQNYNFTSPLIGSRDEFTQFNLPEPYRDKFTEPHYYLIKSPNNSVKNTTFIYINGMQNPYEECSQFARHLSSTYDIDLYHVYNAYEGVFRDVLRTAAEMNSYKSAQIHLTAQLVRETIDKGNHAAIFPFSEGVLITKKALELLPENYYKNITIHAFRGPTIIEKKMGHSVMNYISSSDLLSTFFNALTLLYPKNHDRYRIEFLVAARGEECWSHYISSQTYSSAFTDAINDVKLKDPTIKKRSNNAK